MDSMTAAAAAAFRQAGRRVGDTPPCGSPRAVGRNALTHSSWLLANTAEADRRNRIANIYARDPMAIGERPAWSQQQSDGRFLLGVGVIASADGAGLRGHTYGKAGRKPCAPTWKGMRDAPYQAPMPGVEATDNRRGRWDRDDGAFVRTRRRRTPYNTTPQHTAQARSIPRFRQAAVPEVWVLLETDPAAARRAAREALPANLQLENYVNSWRREGFW